MNVSISRIAVFAVAMIAALIVATTYWQTWATASLNDRQENAIQKVAEFSIERGHPRVRRHTVLARNVARRVDGRTLYFRRYPTRGLAAHIVGYSTAGALAHRPRALDERLPHRLEREPQHGRRHDARQAAGTHVTGNDLVLTLDVRAQQAAYRALDGNCGSVVALERRPARARDGVGADVRPEPRREELQGDQPHPRALSATVAAAEPRDGRRVRPRLDVQGRRRGRARVRALQRQHDVLRPRLLHRVRPAREQLRHVDARAVSFPTAMQHSINSFFCNLGKELGPARSSTR